MKCTSKKIQIVVATVISSCFYGAFSSVGAITQVTVGPNLTDTFSPATVAINTGDTVVWTWSGSFHSSTSGVGGTTNGLWDSGVHNPPFSFTNTFNSAGNFPYFCTVHVAFGMTGEVDVTGGSAPPAVTITNPPDGITLSSPASFTLAATASSASATVTNVQFFQDAASLGNVASSPYSVPVSGLGAGDHVFSAVAADSSGLRATNSITVHVVTAVPIVLSGPQMVSPTDFRFEYTANAGLKYVVQGSSDLTAWTALRTNQAAGSPETFDDTGTSASNRFYRVFLLPNP